MYMHIDEQIFIKEHVRRRVEFIIKDMIKALIN